MTAFVLADALHDIRTRLQMLGDSESVERLFGVRLTDAETTFAVAVHLSGRSVVLEIEPEEAGRRRD